MGTQLAWEFVSRFDLDCYPSSFDAGRGTCDTYSGRGNRRFFRQDCNECGCAVDICAECTPDCDEPWDAGYGTCDTYSIGASNHAWCHIHCNSCGCAKDVCSECAGEENLWD